jgi:hypothetical protein
MLRLKRTTEVPGVIEQSLDMDIRLGVELLLTQRVPVAGRGDPDARYLVLLELEIALD